MSLAVKHLNGDTTFLLTFSPTERHPSTPPLPGYYQTPGSFTILVDPWLSGPTLMWHPKFLLSKHTTPSSIDHLSQIPEPNVVLISQSKPDHCHEATLRQLDPSSPITTILAEPGAARRIRGMRHFHPSMVHGLRPFSEKNPDSVIRFFIPPTFAGGAPGEATISFIPARMDVAGVHNAIGITYRPPTSYHTMNRPSTPVSLNYFGSTSQDPYISANLPITPPDSPQPSSNSIASSVPASSEYSTTFSAPHRSRTISSVSSLSSTTKSQPAGKSLSVIYSPHGVDYSLIRPYASSHLMQRAALPLSLLLHSFDRVNNPWWMGGNVAAGLPGGVEIARNLMAHCWISAHDEDKDNSGISVANVKVRKYNLREVAEMVGGSTKVANQGVGEEMILRA